MEHTMKFAPSFDIWAVPVDLLKHTQPGQWVYAGDRSNKGRFLGVKRSGVVVVAWLGNIRNKGDHASRLEYTRALRNYALGDRK
jgi:hypothetical protein